MSDDDSPEDQEARDQEPDDDGQLAQDDGLEDPEAQNASEVADGPSAFGREFLAEDAEDRRIWERMLQVVPGGADDAPPGPRPPQMIGRFVVERPLDEGGMGLVYVCWDPVLERPVAVKRIRGPVDARSRARFREEIRVLARIDHENVVKVFEPGEDREGVFFAMEFVCGMNLDTWMKQDRSDSERLLCLIPAAKGLAAAHKCNITHLDIKPKNVLVGEDGKIKVADFGVARYSSNEPACTPGHVADDGQATHRGADGTLAYMAPEHRQGNPVPASDQYSFCVMAWQVLWGALPERDADGCFIGKESTRGFGRDACLRRLLLRGMSFEPERRPTMTELTAELEALAERPTRLRKKFGWALLSGSMLAISWVAIQEIAAPLCRGTILISANEREQLSNVLARMDNSASHAPQSRARVEAALDDWAKRWSEQRVLLCDLFRLESHERDDDRLEERELCLDIAAQRFDELHHRLLVGDASTLANAVTSVEELPDPSACMEIGPLFGYEVPSLAMRMRVAPLRSGLSRAHLDRVEGRWADAQRKLNVLEPEVVTTGYGPLLADLRSEQAMLDDASGRPVQAAARYDDALHLAEKIGNDPLVFVLLLERAELEMNEFRNLDAARVWLQQAESRAERLVLGDRKRARLAYIDGWLAQLEGRTVVAEARLREAVTLAGEWTPELPAYLDSLAFVVVDPQEGLTLRKQALTLALKHWGDRHPRTANHLYNYGAARYDIDGGGERERQLAFDIWAEKGGNGPRLWQARVSGDLAMEALKYGNLERAEQRAREMAEMLAEVLPPGAPDHGEAALLLAQIEATRADRGDDAPARRRAAILHAKRALVAFSNTPNSSIRDSRLGTARLLIANQHIELLELEQAEQELAQVLADPSTNTGDRNLAHLRQAELALRRSQLDTAELELGQIDAEPWGLGGEQFCYELLRSIVEHRRGRLDASQRRALRDAFIVQPLPEQTLAGWLEALAVDNMERAALGL